MMNNDLNDMQNVLLVIIDDGKDIIYSTEELSRLVETAQGKVVGTIMQKRNTLDNATVVGSGKLQEISEFVKDNQIDVLVFDCDLSSIQRRNIREKTDCYTIDKTDLILDIFALHATSAEGKKQVELAQLQYNLATKDNYNYSRQGGGIGTRGPGETKLETNKRLIRGKMHSLQQEINQLSSTRQLQQKSRKEKVIYTVALVGYTNAGKSTLFNTITNNDVLAKDMLFATLDTTTRRCVLASGIEILFVDTVGFIKDLPHSLITAFKSTLDITREADLILNVCDASSHYAEEHLNICKQILQDLNVTAPIIDVYNKCDLLLQDNLVNSDNSIFVSGLNGYGLTLLLQNITDRVMENYTTLNLIAPFDCLNELFALLKRYAASFDAKYADTNVVASALVDKRYASKYSKFLEN